MRDRWIRCLLTLYPGSWRRRYGREFSALLEEERLGARVLLDVASHCLRQRFSPDVLVDSHKDSHLRPGARVLFPRAIILLMTVSFGAVVVAIRIASSVAGDRSGAAWTTLGSVLLFMLLTMCAAATVAQGILRLMRRSGFHRLEQPGIHGRSGEVKSR